MLIELKTVVKRSSGTLLQDAIGLCAVIVMLLGALSLPSFV